MLDIEIKTIPHNEQRYETCGDYYDDGDVKRFRVSELEDWRYEFLVAVHELIEEALTRYHGIPEPLIKEFDVVYESDKSEGLIPMENEPGDDPRAPYWQEHQLSTGIERTLAALLKVNWQEYEEACLALPRRGK